MLGGLRNTKFFSLSRVEYRHLPSGVAAINAEPFQKRDGSRNSVFEAEEKPVARPLPARRYDYADWKIGARVHQDHHIEVGRAYYSVHYTLVGQRVDARLGAHTVEIFQRGVLIATHPRAIRRYQRLTIEAHRPPEHRAYRELGIDNAGSRRGVGPATREILERQLSRKRHPGEVIREALGVLRLVQDFSAEKLEQTAALALELGLYGYAAVNDLIKRPSTTASHEKARSRLGTHPNVRGADYYQ